ncbi:hypothetical protein [uncultured Ruminococcus sp.]|uniref:hypothetical protein n=1 Tax=uncultured Ruminococcus sp. TaxID=165186 RepID=UPI0026010E3B|nr:hypothetical protein [uncultured Ruminococcus sp.]
MSEQMKDPFVWENKVWDLVGAEDIYSLFDPKKFGLSPSPRNTACWKGFVVQIKVTKDGLMLDTLYVYCQDNKYPPINGVSPIDTDLGMKYYDNINLKLEYSGTITVGTNMLSQFHGRAFIGGHAYEKTFELTFEKGALIESKDTSGTYHGF